MNEPSPPNSPRVHLGAWGKGRWLPRNGGVGKKSKGSVLQIPVVIIIEPLFKPGGVHVLVDQVKLQDSQEFRSVLILNGVNQVCIILHGFVLDQNIRFQRSLQARVGNELTGQVAEQWRDQLAQPGGFAAEFLDHIPDVVDVLLLDPGGPFENDAFIGALKFFALGHIEVDLIEFEAIKPVEFG